MGSAGASPSGSQSPPLGGSLVNAVMTSAGGWVSVSPVEMLVQRACDPSFSEPPYPVHVELAELINTKKANTYVCPLWTLAAEQNADVCALSCIPMAVKFDAHNSPREAAMATVRMVNHRNPHVSILALALIDSLAQSCGYPIHLQVATKEFLNELVRRFPERPPPFPGPVMQRILELIHSWKEGICVTSRWKEDLGNIRDMHRLLSFKGVQIYIRWNRDYDAYPLCQGTASVTFPEVMAPMLLPTWSVFKILQFRTNLTTFQDNLKSPEELENEDREAQSAVSCIFSSLVSYLGYRARNSKSC